jgi:hypothetical protein
LKKNDITKFSLIYLKKIFFTLADFQCSKIQDFFVLNQSLIIQKESITPDVILKNSEYFKLINKYFDQHFFFFILKYFYRLSKNITKRSLKIVHFIPKETLIICIHAKSH